MRSLRSRNRWKNHFPQAIRRAGRLGVSLMKRTLRKKGIVDVLMSTDGVRFARCVSEGSSAFAGDGAQRGAKAGALLTQLCRVLLDQLYR